MNRNRYSFAKTSGVSRWKHLCRPLSPPWPPTSNTGQTFSPEASVCVTKVFKDHTVAVEGREIFACSEGVNAEEKAEGFPAALPLGSCWTLLSLNEQGTNFSVTFQGHWGKVFFFFFLKQTKIKQNKKTAYGKGLDQTGNLMGIGHNVLPKWRYIGLSPYHYSDEPVV